MVKFSVRICRHFLAVLFLCALAQPAFAASDFPGRDKVIAATVAGLCDKPVVLLGENAHGDGRTIAFKVDLVKRLVDRCGFRNVLFEADHYDFMALSRETEAGTTVSSQTISAAIGGVWNQTEEIQPLVVLLTERLATGKIRLGGLDDQLGHFGARYSNDEMPSELTAYLADDRREVCRALLRREIYAEYSSSAPRSADDESALLACLDDARAAIRHTSLKPGALAFYEEITTAIARAVKRRALTGEAFVADRDDAMYAIFEWYRRDARWAGKTIVWAANSHITRDARAFGASSADRSLGARIAAAQEQGVFSLGFSAAGGEFRWSRTATRPIPDAAEDSLERRVLGNREAVLVDRGTLERQGEIAASLNIHNSRSFRWSTAFDGIVVFDREQATSLK